MTIERPMFPPRNQAFAVATAADNIVTFKRRRRKPTSQEIECLNSFNESRQLAATLIWPEIPPPRDWDGQSDDELGGLDFEGMPEFRGDGVGCGTPEFREQLEAYFGVITAATRHALATLGLSRRQIADLAAECPEGAKAIVGLFKDGEDYAMRLIRLLHGAAVRQICGIVLSEMEAEEGNEPAAQANRKSNGPGDQGRSFFA